MTAYEIALCVIAILGLCRYLRVTNPAKTKDRARVDRERRAVCEREIGHDLNLGSPSAVTTVSTRCRIHGSASSGRRTVGTAGRSAGKRTGSVSASGSRRIV